MGEDSQNSSATTYYVEVAVSSVLDSIVAERIMDGREGPYSSDFFHTWAVVETVGKLGYGVNYERTPKGIKVTISKDEMCYIVQEPEWDYAEAICTAIVEALEYDT